MKQAVIRTGGKQYLVKENQVLDIDLAAPADAGKKKLEFEPLLVVDDKEVLVGTPLVGGTKVTAEVVEPMVKGDKIKVLKYKPKKRIRKLTGHRQKYTRVKITNIGK